MLYQKQSRYSVEETCKRIADSTTQNKFGVLGVHDLKEKMNEKGVDFEPACKIIEVCNPFQAKTVLEANMSLYRSR